MKKLFSEEYMALQLELHRRPEGYGGSGHKWATKVLDLCKEYDCETILDYGCGEGRLREELGVRKLCDNYNPAFKMWASIPRKKYDLVVCTDVLEHIEPEYLDNVLEHINNLSKKAVFFVIALREANKIMTDGRNAHLIIQPQEWWLNKVNSHININWEFCVQKGHSIAMWGIKLDVSK